MYKMATRMGVWIAGWILLEITAFAVAKSELVLLYDVNNDEHRRHIDGGLPATLQFSVKRMQGDVELTLEENDRLNANAPVYEVKTDDMGTRRVLKVDTTPLQQVGFYQNKIHGGTFAVRCQTVAEGPCTRVLTGNFYISGKNYDLIPTPEVVKSYSGSHYKRENKEGVPHLLVESRARNDMSCCCGKEYQRNVPDLTDPTYKQELDDEADISSSRRQQEADDPDEKPSIDVELQEEVHLLNSLKQVLDRIRKQGHKEGHMEKRAAQVYVIEVLVVIDSALWHRWYQITNGTGTMSKADATKYRLREYFAHVINGASLRFESIEDTELQLYVALSGFLFYTTMDADKPFPSNVTTFGDTSYVDSDLYVEETLTWVEGLGHVPNNDHIIIFTGYDLYSNGQLDETEISGIAYVAGVCTDHRVAVCENDGYFATTSIAAHVIGHNLGAYLDGGSHAEDCKPDDSFIMAPFVPALSGDDDIYAHKPWHFSSCSIKAFKGYVKYLDDTSNNCLLDQASNPIDWALHVAKQPGEIYDPDTQCQILWGSNSSFCGVLTDEEICSHMRCKGEYGDCMETGGSAVQGTSCGPNNANKWCQKGFCIKKTGDVECADTGYDLDGQHYTCSKMASLYDSQQDFCRVHEQHCCASCSDDVISRRQGNAECADTGYSTNGQDYTCSEMATHYDSRHDFCSIHGNHCCATCIKAELTKREGAECADSGYTVDGQHYTCNELATQYYSSGDFCSDHGTHCCATCIEEGPGSHDCVDSGYVTEGQHHTCSDVAALYDDYNYFCSDHGVHCCATCDGQEMTKREDGECIDSGYTYQGQLYNCSELSLWYEDSNDLCSWWSKYCCDTCKHYLVNNTNTAGELNVNTDSPSINTGDPDINTNDMVVSHCVDNGFDGLICSQLKKIHGDRLCVFHTIECCHTCSEECTGNADVTIDGDAHNCTHLHINVFHHHSYVMCRAYGQQCCAICTDYS